MRSNKEIKRNLQFEMQPTAFELEVPRLNRVIFKQWYKIQEISGLMGCAFPEYGVIVLYGKNSVKGIGKVLIVSSCH